MSKAWKFEKSGNYYEDLKMRESSNNKKAINGSHLGFYQIGIGALIDTKYIDKDTKQWTGKNGIYSQEQFLDNEQVQEIAIRKYHKKVWEEPGYLKNYQQYVGQEIGGVKLTQAGILSCAHLN